MHAARLERGAHASRVDRVTRRVAVLVVAASWLGACSDPPPIELAGRYSGDARCEGETLRMNEDVDEHGRGDGTTSRFSWSDDDVVLTIRRIDPTQLEVDVVGCTLRFEHSPAPHDTYATLALHQTCRIEEQTFDHEVSIQSGYLMFERAVGSVSLHLDTELDVGDLHRAGGEHLRWFYDFEGARPRP